MSMYANCSNSFPNTTVMRRAPSVDFFPFICAALCAANPEFCHCIGSLVRLSFVRFAGSRPAS